MNTNQPAEGVTCTNCGTPLHVDKSVMQEFVCDNHHRFTLREVTAQAQIARATETEDNPNAWMQFGMEL